MYELFLQNEAEKDLENLDAKVAKRVLRKLDWLAENLEDADPEALTENLAGLFKLRVGDYRVIYEVVERKEVIVIHFIGTGEKSTSDTDSTMERQSTGSISAW